MLKGYEICCYRLENHSKEIREAFNDSRFLSNDKWMYYPGMKGSTVANASSPLPPGYCLSPEVLIGTSLVVAKGFTLDRDKSREQMKECFEIVMAEDMKPYLSKYDSSWIPHDGAEIHSIEDI
jgi:hypothetical protein